MAIQSASGSLAIMNLLFSLSAYAIANFKAPAPSSGFGNATVENSGSASIYSKVRFNGLKPSAAIARVKNGVPTPCIAV